jgi:hypothetical protein
MATLLDLCCNSSVDDSIYQELIMRHICMIGFGTDVYEDETYIRCLRKFITEMEYRLSTKASRDVMLKVGAEIAQCHSRILR